MSKILPPALRGAFRWGANQAQCIISVCTVLGDTMARRGITNRGQRDAFDPSLAELLAPLEPMPFVSPFDPSDAWRSWTEIEDRRVFDPERAYRPALSFSGNPAPARRIPATDQRWSTIGFDHPRQAVICARRKSRREVIFAKRRHRRGRGGSRRRNWWSDVRC